MDDKIINLDTERNRRVDPSTVTKDRDGREMIEFCASYDAGEGTRWMMTFFAYDREDAAARVEAMKASLKLEGPSHEFEPNWGIPTPVVVISGVTRAS